MTQHMLNYVVTIRQDLTLLTKNKKITNEYGLYKKKQHKQNYSQNNEKRKHGTIKEDATL